MQDVSEECMRAGRPYSKGLSVGGAGGRGGPGFCPKAPPGKYSQPEGPTGVRTGVWDDCASKQPAYEMIQPHSAPRPSQVLSV